MLKYLARYTHRVAIANGRLVSLDEGQVTFTYKDYARVLLGDSADNGPSFRVGGPHAEREDYKMRRYPNLGADGAVVNFCP